MDPMGTLVVIFIFVFSIVFISKSASIIKAWINRKDTAYDQEKFDRLAKAFIQHKKRSQQQIEKLEAQIKKIGSKASAETEESETDAKINKSIEIEPERPNGQHKTSSGKMENMLRERD